MQKMKENALTKAPVTTCMVAYFERYPEGHTATVGELQQRTKLKEAQIRRILNSGTGLMLFPEAKKKAGRYKQYYMRHNVLDEWRRGGYVVY